MAASPMASQADHVAAKDEITFMDAHLYMAAAKGHADDLTRLSEDDLLRQLTPQRNTLLHVASQFGQLRSVQFILHFRSPSPILKIPNRNGDTALHLAAREGHCEVVNALIHAAKSLPPDMESDVEPHKAMMRMPNETRGTALHEAVRYNHLQVVELLVKEDPEFIYGADSGAYTPLYMAAERGYGDIVKILIGNTHSPPAHSGILGRTALHAAVIRDDLEMTRMILEWKPILAKEVDEEGWSPLHCAAYLEHAAITDELLNKAPDKSVIYLGIKDGNATALHIAVWVRNIKIVKLLVSRAPDCSEQVDARGHNVFHFAMMRNYRPNFGSELLKENELLRVRGLVNGKDDDGDTPLHLLAFAGVDDQGFVMDKIVDKKAQDHNNLYAYEKMSPQDFSTETIGESTKEVGVAFRPHQILQPVKKENAEKEDWEDKMVSSIRQGANNQLVAAALIATVTFAAGFTLPGGYGDKDGMAVLSRKASFKAFVVSDAIALTLSVGAVSFYFLMAMSFQMGWRTHARLLVGGSLFTLFGMVAMMVAFVSGLYAVLPYSFGLPILICVAIACFLYLLEQVRLALPLSHL